MQPATAGDAITQRAYSHHSRHASRPSRSALLFPFRPPCRFTSLLTIAWSTLPFQQKNTRIPEPLNKRKPWQRRCPAMSCSQAARARFVPRFSDYVSTKPVAAINSWSVSHSQVRDDEEAAALLAAQSYSRVTFELSCFAESRLSGQVETRRTRLETCVNSISDNTMYCIDRLSLCEIAHAAEAKTCRFEFQRLESMVLQVTADEV
jgi:hypothetical protein